MKLRAAKSKLSGDILIPASKSHTIRAVSIAAMADGVSVLKNPLMSADALSSIAGAREMGAEIEMGKDWIIRGTGGQPVSSCRMVYVGNSGTTLRIQTALCALADHPVKFDGDKSIRTRPMTPLLSALERLGVRIAKSADGRCPFVLQGPIRSGKTTVNGISSQFLTALLIACPLAKGDTEIIVENLHEKPYVEMTLDWLRKMNIQFEQKGLNWFYIKGNQKYKAFERFIPADFSSAAFSACAAAITGSELLIRGLDFDDHQGDKVLFAHLEKMGVSLKHTSEGVWVKGGELQGIDIDMNDTPDLLPALAVTGCFAGGTTRLLNVAQARLKECDRIAACNAELSKMGAVIEELNDGMVIHHSKLTGTELHGYDDHRMVMALAVAGLAAEGETVVDTAGAIEVTYPSFVEDLRKIGGNIMTSDE
ncbi:MAG: 3-phosphoshikimate 1-carboxyvinyltransferase [Bacteroidales bacterium]|nr:3-phosphoshikimate 1-carboxyvinyltransferase [Bacteroidales bacterium]MBN2761922.1 3-phosphoshikimate 1-carboxyvinyltransferase [Bacteroidales bacterium]